MPTTIRMAFTRRCGASFGMDVDVMAGLHPGHAGIRWREQAASLVGIGSFRRPQGLRTTDWLLEHDSYLDGYEDTDAVTTQLVAVVWHGV